MTKEELLQELTVKLSTGEISQSELLARMNMPEVSIEKPKTDRNFSLNKTLYLVGGAIVTIGLVIFFQQIWNDLGSLGRIFVTLGVGLIMAISGSLFMQRRPDDSIGSVFHAIGGFMIPGGAAVFLNEVAPENDSVWPIVFIFGCLSLFYFLLTSHHRKVVLTLFLIANTTAFIYSLYYAVAENTLYDGWHLLAYLTILIGAVYIVLANQFKGTWNAPLVRALYFFGSAGVYISAFSLVVDMEGLAIFYFFLVLGGLYISILERSRTLLITSTLALIVHVAYITGKYFADSLGWPLSLILLGFIFIGLGYMSIRINKLYISRQ